MRVFAEKTEKFRVCGVKAGLDENNREKVISDFRGNDGGARFECLLGCGQGFYGIIRREESRSFLCAETYLYGKSVYPTVYMPAGGAQWAVPAGTYLKACFSEKEKQNLTVEGAWKFIKDIYIPSCSYVRDDSNPYEIEYYGDTEGEGALQLWIPVLSTEDM